MMGVFRRSLSRYDSVGAIGVALSGLLLATLPLSRPAGAYPVCRSDNVSGCEVIGDCWVFWCATDAKTGTGKCDALPRGTRKCVYRERALLDNCEAQPVQPCCSRFYTDTDTHLDCSSGGC